jgi:ATP-dependent Clp protease protease subunit
MKRKNQDVMGLSQSDWPNDSSYVWVEKFNDEGLQHFYKKFMQLEADDTVKVIPVIISSYGGYTYIALAMRDIIKTSSKPVATAALGKAMSSGAILLAAGTRGLRFASPDSYMLIHEVSSGFQGKTTDIQTEAQHTIELNKKILQNLAADTGKTVRAINAQINKLKNSDWLLTAAQAKSWGLIDHIGVPRLYDQPAMRTIMAGKPYTKTDVTEVAFIDPLKKS